MIFVIILTRVLQLCAYVPSNSMRDQSTIVCLENVCVFVGFKFWKVLNALGEEKSLIKMSQCTRQWKWYANMLKVNFRLTLLIGKAWHQPIKLILENMCLTWFRKSIVTCRYNCYFEYELGKIWNEKLSINIFLYFWLWTMNHNCPN